MWDQSKEEVMQAWCSHLPRQLSGMSLMLIRFRNWIGLLKVGSQRTNLVHLCWVPGYREYFGNGKARKDRESPFIGPKTSCGLSKGSAKTKAEIHTLDNGSTFQDNIMKKCQAEVLKRGSRTDFFRWGKSQIRQVKSRTTGHGLLKCFSRPF